MLVQAKDGLFYIDPIVNGDHAFLTFANEFPEVVVKSRSGQYGRRYIRQFGAKWVEYQGLNKFLFPDGSYRDGVSFKVELMEPIACPDLHKGSVTTLSTEPYLVWYYYWPTQMVLELMKGTGNPPLGLIAFLIGKPKWECGDLVNRARRIVRQQIGKVDSSLREVKLCSQSYWRRCRSLEDK